MYGGVVAKWISHSVFSADRGFESQWQWVESYLKQSFAAF